MFAKNSLIPYVNHGYSGQMAYGKPVYLQMNSQQLSRNQPYPYQSPPQNYDWYPYQQPNPYYQQQYQPMGPNFQTGAPQQIPYSSQQQPAKDAQFLFQNPLQPQDEFIPNQYLPMNNYPLNPYPKQNGMLKQPGGMNSIMNSFKSQDGTVDFNKMMNTAGQMMNAVTQVSSLVKGFGGIFKV